LVVDNLLDLTHLAFVHGTTIGNPALVEQAQVKVQRTEDGVAVTRWIVDAPPPPTFVKAGGFTANVDRWQIINFTPPAFLRLDVRPWPPRHPARARPKASAGAASACGISTPSRRKQKPRAIISGARRTISTSRTRRRPTC